MNMKIKGADGHEYNVTSQGQGTLNTVLGAFGSAGAINSNGGIGGVLNGILGGGNNNANACPANMPISRYEAAMMQELANKDGKIALLESNIYTDSKIADVYERLNNKIGAMKDEQNAINLQQAVYNGVNTAAVECIKGQIAQLQGLTKLVVPNSSICPGWGNVTITPATTPAG